MFFSIVILSTLAADSEDCLRSLVRIYQRRVEQNVMIRATVNRNEIQNGKTQKMRSEVEFCSFQDNIYCMNYRDQDGKKYQYKICKGCLAEKTISTSDNKSSAQSFVIMDEKSSSKSKQIFEFRWIGYYSFPYEGVTPGFGKPFIADFYEKPFVNQDLETDDQRCIQLNIKANMGFLRYFVSKKIDRIEKIEFENKENSTLISVESFYRDKTDLFPYKVLKLRTIGGSRLIEQIDVTECTPVIKKDPQFWNPGLVDFRDNIFVSNIVDKKGKSRGDVSYYDGKSVRKPTENELRPSIEFNDKAELSNSDNDRIKKSSYWLYAVPIFFLVAALFFIVRHYAHQRKKRERSS